MKLSRLKNKTEKSQLIYLNIKKRNLAVKLNKKHTLPLTQNLFGISVSRIFKISTQRVTLTLR